MEKFDTAYPLRTWPPHLLYKVYKVSRFHPKRPLFNYSPDFLVSFCLGEGDVVLIRDPHFNIRETWGFVQAPSKAKSAIM